MCTEMTADYYVEIKIAIFQVPIPFGTTTNEDRRQIAAESRQKLSVF